MADFVYSEAITDTGTKILIREVADSTVSITIPDATTTILNDITDADYQQLKSNLDNKG